MKKLTALFLSMLLVLGLTACKGNNTSSDKGTEPTSSNSTSEPGKVDTTAPDTSDDTDKTDEESDPTEKTDKKVLVVYYSATNNTERIAKAIAEAAGADLFKIEPENEYTSADLDWTDKNSRVCREHDDESLRDISLKTTQISGWEDYDTVFIGYPIWWGIAAWPVSSFVKANDFSGKTVIPFCTSSSSGLGESGKLLCEIADSGSWQEGQRFSSSASDETVKNFVNTLGLNK